MPIVREIVLLSLVVMLLTPIRADDTGVDLAARAAAAMKSGDY